MRGEGKAIFFKIATNESEGVGGDELEVELHLLAAGEGFAVTNEQAEVAEEGALPGQDGVKADGVAGGVEGEGDFLADGLDGAGVEGGKRDAPGKWGARLDGIQAGGDGGEVVNGKVAVFEGVAVGRLAAAATRGYG